MIVLGLIPPYHRIEANTLAIFHIDCILLIGHAHLMFAS